MHIKAYNEVTQSEILSDKLDCISNNDNDHLRIITYQHDPEKPPQNIAFERRRGQFESQPGFHVEVIED